MEAWINAILTAEWLLGFSMALAFKRLADAVGRRISQQVEPDN